MLLLHPHTPWPQDTRVTLPPDAREDNEGCFFYLAGVNDYESDPQYGPALDGRDDSVATVLLAHEPIQVAKLFLFPPATIIVVSFRPEQVFQRV